MTGSARLPSTEPARAGSTWRAAVGFALYPLIVGASLYGAYAGLSGGHSVNLVLPLVSTAAGGVVLALERLLPYRREWNRSHGDVPTDVLHLVAGGAAGELGRNRTMVAMTFAGARLSAALGTGLWPARWPLVVQLALALVLAELGVYWLHRLEHQGKWLWRLHAVHHSTPRLYFLNSARNHPIDTLLTFSAIVAPLALLGASEMVLALTLVYAAVHAFLQHCNVDVRLGPLNRVFSMAEVHRWHHSRRLEDANANYGQTLLIWDFVFGTHKDPRGEPPVDVGLTDLPDFPTGWAGQVASPFLPWLWRQTAPAPPPGEPQAPKT